MHKYVDSNEENKWDDLKSYVMVHVSKSQAGSVLEDCRFSNYNTL